MAFEDRPYQGRAIDSTGEAFDKGIRRMMWVMATGTGKTVVYSKLYKEMKSRLPGRMHVYAHTEELVKKNQQTLQELNPDVKVDREMAGDYADPQAEIISASIATLGRAGSKRPERFDWNFVDKVVIDEAHHSTGEAYGRVLQYAGVMAPDSKKLLLGVTATPQRPDGKALGDIYESISFVYGLRQAIKEGYLVDIRGFRISTDTQLDGVSTHNGDFASGELAATVNNEPRNRQIVMAWKNCNCHDMSTVAFCVDIQHGKDLAQAFKNAGIAAEAVWGDDPERAEKIEAHRAGKIRVLCNCQVLTEGYDDPSITCIIIACPTKSGVKFSQMVGRSTRLAPWIGKVFSVVLDIVDATMKHSVVTLPTLMGLAAGLDLQGRSMVEAAEEMEAAQEEYPGLDLTTLKAIGDLPPLIKSVDLFDIKFPAEVERNSDLVWFRAADGGYRINIPKSGPERAGFLKIYENALGRWDIVGRIKEVELAATRMSMEEAFKASDEQIRKRIPKITLSYILREATWHNKPVSKAQMTMIKRLFPHKEFPFSQMTSGMASKIINERLSRK